MKQLAADVELDLAGLKCPLPVLRTRNALAGMRKGQVLKVSATDPGALKDIPAFAKMSGHELLCAEKTDAGSRFALRK